MGFMSQMSHTSGQNTELKHAYNYHAIIDVLACCTDSIVDFIVLEIK
jgi:hypothetical protein